MKKTFIAAVISAMFSTHVRARTTDVAFSYRMGAGFPGDVNRTHPASIEPALVNTSNPPRLYGDPVIVDSATNSYRAFLTTDSAVATATAVLVRPFPTQQQTGGMSSPLGAATAPTTGLADFLIEGYIIVKCNNFGANPPSKGSAVYVWCAASTGNHVQGGFEAAAGTGIQTAALTNAVWNGPADANGVAEIRIFQK